MGVIDGKKVAEKVLQEVKTSVKELKGKGMEACLAVVLVGNDEGSRIYVKKKVEKSGEVGIKSRKIELPGSTTEGELLEKVEELNKDGKVNGILVQFPLPGQISEERIRNAVEPRKDVDGLNCVNVGKLHEKQEAFVPCTPKGIMRLLDEYGVEIQGRNAVVVGRSALVGRPVAQMLLNRNATVTVCHSKTRDLREHTLKADILVVAAGRPGLVTADMVKEGAVVVDVGINRVHGKVVGDVDFGPVSKKASLISPVPGGAGPMTIAMLLQNTVNAATMQSKNIYK